MRDTRQMTAYERLCYIASQERADEIRAFAKSETEAEERAHQLATYGAIIAAALLTAFFLFSIA